MIIMIIIIILVIEGKKWKRKVNNERGYWKQMIAIRREIGTFEIT